MPRKTDLTPDVQKTIVDNLTLGCTIKDTCALAGISTVTYFAWLKRGERNEKRDEPFVSFLNAVTHAQVQAKRAAVAAIRANIRMDNVQMTTETETYEETRLRKVGNGVEEPYTYRKTVTTNRQSPLLPDWRAAIEYLKRRDPEEWSDKSTIRIEGLDELLKIAQLKGIQASDLFAAMIAELADADSTGSR